MKTSCVILIISIAILYGCAIFLFAKALKEELKDYERKNNKTGQR